MDRTYRYACVVDARGRCAEFVLRLLTPRPDGGENWKTQHYTLKEGERLAEELPPPRLRRHAGDEGLVDPRLLPEDAAWREGATAEELAAWEAAHPAPEAAAPTPAEQLRADMDYIAVMTGVRL